MTAAVNITPPDRAGPPAAGSLPHANASTGGISFASLLNGQSLSELALIGLSQNVDLNTRLPEQTFELKTSTGSDRSASLDARAIEPDDRSRDRDDAARDPQRSLPNTGPAEIAATVPQAISEGSPPPQADAARSTVEPAAPQTGTPRDADSRPAQIAPRTHLETPQTRPAEQPPTPIKSQITEAPKPLVSQPTAALGARAAVVAQIAADKATANPSMEGGLAAKANQGSQSAANTLAQHAHGPVNNGNAVAGQPRFAANAATSGNAQVAKPAATPAVQATNAAVNGRVPFVGAASGASQSGTMQTALQFGEFAAQSANTLTNGPVAPRAAETAAAPRPQPAIPARVVTNQVAVQIQKAVANGTDRINIQLKPAELGRVDIRLDVAQDGRVSAVVSVERQDTLELLQRDARTLQSTLQDAGLKTGSDSLSFELRQQSASGRNEQEALDNRPDGESATDEDTTTGDVAHAGTLGDGRIDIEI